MAGDPVREMQEALLDRHYAKVPPITKTSRHKWKCLLQGCPFPGTFSQKAYIEKHWRNDHVDCHLHITEKLPPGPKTTELSRKADKKELIASCDKHFGNFCQRWKLHKQDKLENGIRSDVCRSSHKTSFRICIHYLESISCRFSQKSRFLGCNGCIKLA